MITIAVIYISGRICSLINPKVLINTQTLKLDEKIRINDDTLSPRRSGLGVDSVDHGQEPTSRWLLTKLSLNWKFLISGRFPLYTYWIQLQECLSKSYFVILIGATIFPLALEVQRLHENEKSAKYSGSCFQLRK